MPQPRPLYIGMHNEDVLCSMPLKGTHDRSCEYNLLSRPAILVQQVEPHDARRPEEERFRQETGMDKMEDSGMRTPEG